MPVESTTLAQSFAASWERVGGNAHLVADLAGARKVIAKIVGEQGIDTAVAWESPLLQSMELGPLFRWYRTAGPGGAAKVSGEARAGGQSTFKASCAEAGVGITTAALGAADTGTLLLPWSGPRPRSTMILPPVWIAVVPIQRLVPGRPELFQYLGRLAKSGHPPAEMGLVTGPSRTGDIESLLLQGIHGPGIAHAVLVDAVDAALAEEQF